MAQHPGGAPALPRPDLCVGALCLGLSCLMVRFSAPFRTEFSRCSEWMGNSTAIVGQSPPPCGDDCCLATFLHCEACTSDVKGCSGAFPSRDDSSDVCTLYRCTAYVEECKEAGFLGGLLASEVRQARPLRSPAATRDAYYWIFPSVPVHRQQSRHLTQIVLIVLILAPLKSISKLVFAATPLPWRGEYPK